MTRKRFAAILIPALALTLAASGGAQASSIVQNVDFLQYTGGHSGAPSQINNTTAGGYTSLTDWTVAQGGTTSNPMSGTSTTSYSTYTFLFAPSGTNNPVSWYPNLSQNLGFTAAVPPPPDGQNFVAIDGYTKSNAIQQTLTGLIIGQQYTLTFDWATTQYNTAASAPYTEQFYVGFGNSVQHTALESLSGGAFSGWMPQTMVFTADSTSVVLAFLSVGTPVGGPPVGLLSDVQVVAGLVPEPSTLVLMGIGVVGYVGIGLRRRARAAAV